MKKYLTYFLALVLLLSLSACSSPAEISSAPSSSAPVTPVPVSSASTFSSKPVNPGYFIEEKDGYTLEVSIEGPRKATVSLTDPSLEASYNVNLPGTSVNTLEYIWEVIFYTTEPEYAVSTSHFVLSDVVGKPSTKTLEDMQTDFWEIDEEGASTKIFDVDVALEINEKTIIWTLEIPELIADFDFYEFTQYTVYISMPSYSWNHTFVSA